MKKKEKKSKIRERMRRRRRRRRRKRKEAIQAKRIKEGTRRKPASPDGIMTAACLHARLFAGVLGLRVIVLILFCIIFLSE